MYMYMIHTVAVLYEKRTAQRSIYGHGFCAIRQVVPQSLRYPIFSTRYSVMCKVYTGYCGTREIEHGICACTVDNPRAKAPGLSLRTGAQTMLHLSLKSNICTLCTCTMQFFEEKAKEQSGLSTLHLRRWSTT